MKYIIPSIGRAGSTLIWTLIASSSQKDAINCDNFQEIARVDEGSIKTHDFFHYEPSYDYRAIFMYDDIEDIIASLYEKNKHFLHVHFRHLKIPFIYWLICFLLLQIEKAWGKRIFREKIFAFLIKGDKFKFKRNVQTWKKSKHVLFIDYKDLHKDKAGTLQRISDFVGCKIDDFELRPRSTSTDAVPQSLKDLIKIHYADFPSLITS